jgi:hypothetical protein
LTVEVGQEAAEPPLGDVLGAGALRLGADDRGELTLRADEEDVLAARDDLADELLRELELAQRLLQVDDVDAVALGEDEPAHLGVPPARLVAEVDPCGEELLEIGRRHVGCVMLGGFGVPSVPVGVSEDRGAEPAAPLGDSGDV